MTINLSDNSPRISYSVAAGVTQTSFTVSFEFFDNDDLNVYVDGVLKTLTTDYSVTGGDGSTGTITMSVTGAAGGSTVVVTRDIDLDRTTDFPSSGPFNIASLNTELDRFVAIAADLKDQSDRSLQLTDYDAAVSLVLPDVNTRKGKTLAFNEATGAVEAGPSTSDVQTVSATAADIATLADIEDGTDATDAIQTVASISSNVTTVAGVNANVTTVAGISANVTTVAGISANVTTVAGDQADIGTVANNISDVNTAASNITDIQNASTNAATATTKASEAATSATNAATSETNAGNSATAAASSASAAATSETNAANSAAAAATALDSFDDRYLGSKTSDPTVDNDGNALVSGALYFNSTANEMRVYDGANWIAASSAGTASLILYEYTATSGQTTFSGADDNSASLSYAVGNIQVVMNGIVLDPSDFTATSGTSVVLASGAATDDLVNIYAFKSFTVADTVSASAGGTFAGNVAMTGDLTVDTNTLYVDSTNNRVAVNNASPTVTLDVAGTGRFLKTTNNSNILLETTDTDANAAPVLDMYRNSASPADGDQLGKIEFTGENSNGDKVIYGYHRAQARTVTAGAEKSKMSFAAIHEGAEINFFEFDGANDEVVVNETSQNIAFRVETANLTHALCTTSAGIDGVRIGTATSISDARLAVHNGGTGVNTELYRATTSPSGDVLAIRSNVGGSQTLVAGFEVNGDIMSATQNVQAPSDIKLKQDIVDATSQWDDIKALQLRNYRMKSHVVEMGDDAPTHLGVIAQEVEAAGMTGLVDDKPDVDGDFEGPSTKVVKYTMIYLKAVKALQEAMAKIETLEAKVAALEERT